MEFFSWIFFGPAKLVSAWPYAGALIGTSLIAVQMWLTRAKGAAFVRDFFREAAVFAGLLWLIFNLYELQLAAIFLHNRVAGTLRMDLIILVPILYAMTFAAIVSIRAQLITQRRD
jgi:hypothetical protein